MWFALGLLPMLMAIGIAFDMSRTHNAANQLQTALDSAALAYVTYEPETKGNSEADPESKRKDHAVGYFLKNLGTMDDLAITDPTVDFELQPDGSIKAVVDAKYDTIMMSMFGKPHMDIKRSSVAQAGALASPVEIVLVLDTTESMMGQKMADLQIAANGLVDRVLPNPTGSPSKIGVVPFARYVNVGLSRRNEWWLDVRPDGSEPYCSTTYPDSVLLGCRRETSCNVDGFMQPCDVEVCDYDYGDPVTTCSGTITYTWEGCVGSRMEPWNTLDGEYGDHPITGTHKHGYAGCPSELLPLTNNKAEVTTKIGSMLLRGNTYIPIGLIWGQRVLSNKAPFEEGLTTAEANAEGIRKIIVLMTDGTNAAGPWGNETNAYDMGRHTSYHGGYGNDIFPSLCDNVKATGIEIYTVAFQVNDSDTQTLLRNCATDTDYYFNATSGADLISAFNSIGETVSDPRLAR